MFPVFSVDKCFDSYAIDQVLVGAENVDDLLNNLKPIVGTKKIVNKISKEREWRIIKIANLYTDKPYEILDECAYWE